MTWHKKSTAWEDDKWELYHTDKDFVQNNNLADKYPAKLKELQDLWWSEAKKNKVLPLDDRRYERAVDPTRPVASISQPIYSYYPDTSIIHPLAAPQLLGREHTITAYVDIPKSGAEGVLACFGGEFGGWSFFLKDGKLHYVHNYLKLKEYSSVSSSAVPVGKRKLSMVFTPKEKSLKPDFYTGDVSLLVDGKQVAKAADIKMASQYSTMTGYGLLIGRNTGTPISHTYETPFEFSGKMIR